MMTMPTDPSPKPLPPASLQLEEILEHLRRMDQRDRLRTWGGFFRSMLTLIPIVFFVWSLWYFYKNSAEIMKTVANQAASAAAEYTQKQSKDMLDQYMFPKK